MKQIRVDELYAVARVTDSQLSGKAKKSDFMHYVWFYDNVTDILARALLDDNAELQIPEIDSILEVQL